MIRKEFLEDLLRVTCDRWPNGECEIEVAVDRVSCANFSIRFGQSTFTRGAVYSPEKINTKNIKALARGLTKAAEWMEEIEAQMPDSVLITQKPL